MKDKTPHPQLTRWLMAPVRAALSRPPSPPGPWVPHLCPEMFFVVACVLTGMEAWDRRLPETQLSHYGTSFSLEGGSTPWLEVIKKKLSVLKGPSLP